MPTIQAFVFRGNATLAVQEKIFSDTSSFYPGTDGRYRLQCDYFSITNMDMTTSISFSFDNTSFVPLETGQGFAAPMTLDRYYVKSDTTGVNADYKVVAPYKNNWK